jgi:hypothetical protein
MDGCVEVCILCVNLYLGRGYDQDGQGYCCKKKTVVDAAGLCEDFFCRCKATNEVKEEVQ